MAENLEAAQRAFDTMARRAHEVDIGGAQRGASTALLDALLRFEDALRAVTAAGRDALMYERTVVSASPVTYDSNVRCRRYTHSGRAYFKVQSYDTGPQPWREIERPDGGGVAPLDWGPIGSYSSSYIRAQQREAEPHEL